ncbi:MAG: long-chain fatty acid transporter, partial [Betaproteobacteria bacterium HGW-Betaproteobacteria-17]
MKAKGMAGAATTNTDDAFFGANNPAAAAFVGNRIDLGVDLFSPIREASMQNWGGSGMDVTVESDDSYHLVPEFGYNRMLNNNLALGVSVYGNGGMNTKYSEVMPGVNLFGAPGALGIDLMQLIVAPTLAYKVAPNHSIGISPLIGYQLFKADGLGGPTSEHDDAFGYGVRVGYLGKITPTVTIGAAYASKMNFEEFDKYNWLFLENGDFDIPENYNLGVAWQATPAIKLALDYQRINYADVAAIGTAPALGGFGYDNMDVWKLGVEYKHSPKLTLRAGYSHADSPIKGASLADCMAGSANCGETTLNILAPAVIEDHVTLGLTYTLASGNELTMAYMHALKNKVSGQGFDGGGAPTGINSIQMYQNSLGIQYSWKM